MKFEKIFLGALILIFLFIGISIILKQTRTEKTIPVLIVPHFNLLFPAVLPQGYHIGKFENLRFSSHTVVKYG